MSERETVMMVPGPTSVEQSVLEAMATPCTSPDLDSEFFKKYASSTQLLRSFLHTSDDILILGAEGILGLEGACASLFEPGDRVLCIANGPFGKGFASFVSMFGAEPVVFEQPWEKPVSPGELKAFLDTDSDFVGATIIHCETPTGILNPVETLCPLLKEKGIITVVDAVSSIGAHEVRCDEWGIDMVIGASQKCFSAPTGLTFLSVSDKCWEKMDSRKAKIPAYYGNLTLYRNWKESKWFPYTMPWHLINAFHRALEIAHDAGLIERHNLIGTAVREALKAAGIELYPQAGFSNSVTPFCLPVSLSTDEFLRHMQTEHSLLLGGSIGIPPEKRVVRIGHMGDNCRIERVREALVRIEDALLAHGAEFSASIADTFDLRFQ